MPKITPSFQAISGCFILIVAVKIKEYQNTKAVVYVWEEITSEHTMSHFFLPYLNK